MKAQIVPAGSGDMQIICDDLDDLDRRILDALAQNGRLTNVQLAEQLPLTHSAISRRVARLERDGVITGYGAQIDPRALGVTLTAFVGVQRDPAAAVDDMVAALRVIPEVSDAWIVSGDHDFMLLIQAADLQAFSDALLNRIQRVPGVTATRSIFVLRQL